MSIHADRVLYRDDHLLIVNKLAGELVVQAGGRGKQPLVDFLRRTEPGLIVVHRLDFGTSGAIVFARSSEAARKIRESKFAGWKKIYRAIVAGDLARPEGAIRAKLRARTHVGMVDAVTHYHVLARSPVCSFVEARIETGRKHQIRQHFAHIGHPLVLDPLYGNPKRDRSFKRAYRFRRFFLHAFSLDFPHPITGKPIHVEAPLPKPFADVVSSLDTLAAPPRATRDDTLSSMF